MTSLFKSLLWISLLMGSSTLLRAADEVKAEVKKVPLELKAVHPKNSTLADNVHAGRSLSPAGWEKYMLPILDDDRKEIGEEPILLSTRTIVTRSHVQRAMAIPGRLGAIAVLLNEEGGDLLFAATKKMRTGVDRLAIVFGGKALMAPTVNGSLSRDFIIEGLDGPKEVNEVVSALNAPLKK
jgi:hypothetical protein